MRTVYAELNADGLLDLILKWQSQIEREAEERARRLGVSEDEVVAYREGCRRGAADMVATLKLQGLLRVNGK